MDSCKTTYETDACDLTSIIIGIGLIAGTALAIIPAHLKILSLRSADGVSAHTLLLTNVQQMFASWNMLVLKFPQMQMCHLNEPLCQCNLLALYQTLAQWLLQDLEAFFDSNGQKQPRESARPVAETCPLLSRIRLELAKQRIDEPTIEYAAFSRYVQGLREDWYRNPRLMSVAECTEVTRLRSLQSMPTEPVLLEKPRDWYARFWNLDYFKRDCGHDYWFCRPQFPAFDGDEAAIDKVALHVSIGEYVEFARTLQRMDRKCDQEKGLAFPRLTLDGYAPFFGVMRKFFDECWTKLGPEGLPDVTPRLAQVFAHAFSLQDPMETLSRFYKVTLAATGSITRLHVEVAGAHTWFNQIEGRRAFFLFPPSESRKLYEETGGPMQETSGFATSISGVDILAPSAKRHPLFAEAKCQVAVLYLGQTLVIPSGWWWYSVSLDPSVTLWHQFWTEENKLRFPEVAWEYFNYQKMTPEFWTALPQKIEALRESMAEAE